jgi:hypothetical protein
VQPRTLNSGGSVQGADSMPPADAPPEPNP